MREPTIYVVTAAFRDARADCGRIAAASVLEAIAKMRTRKRDWAAKALGCRPEQVVWEAEEDY